MHHRHFILYKPDGYLSQFANNQNKRKNKKLLGGFFDFPDGVMAIGRLDEPSEGILLLTTDGQVSELVRSRSVEKEYYVQIDGLIDDNAINQLRNGVTISSESGPYLTLPCPVERISKTPVLPPRQKNIRDERHGPTSWVSITLSEGKYRQVRKMTAVVGFPTLRLVRVRIGNIQHGTMNPGDVIETLAFNL
ncbi:MAG: pseudouridine synthase [Flavobacteriales bacterium]|nr:pseudouridine synthase [Flavobacteriales bacterium]